MLAFISNFGFGETVVILILAVLIFGKRLPEVAAKAAVQIQRFRRQLLDMRRESGIDDELRAARRALQESVPRDLTNPPEYPVRPRRPDPPEADEFKPTSEPRAAEGGDEDSVRSNS